MAPPPKIQAQPRRRTLARLPPPKPCFARQVLSRQRRLHPQLRMLLRRLPRLPRAFQLALKGLQLRLLTRVLLPARRPFRPRPRWNHLPPLSPDPRLPSEARPLLLRTPPPWPRQRPQPELARRLLAKLLILQLLLALRELRVGPRWPVGGRRWWVMAQWRGWTDQ